MKAASESIPFELRPGETVEIAIDMAGVPAVFASSRRSRRRLLLDRALWVAGWLLAGAAFVVVALQSLLHAAELFSGGVVLGMGFTFGRDVAARLRAPR